MIGRRAEIGFRQKPAFKIGFVGSPTTHPDSLGDVRRCTAEDLMFEFGIVPRQGDCNTSQPKTVMYDIRLAFTQVDVPITTTTLDRVMRRGAVLKKKKELY